MKFVRLLSLYKHLHTQHSDLLPDTEDEKLTCVICDFKAPTHKALLMHMRKHNASDQDDSEIPGKLSSMSIQGAITYHSHLLPL